MNLKEKPLADIFRDYATPKGEYPPIYEMVIGHLRAADVCFLEIGIGTMLEGKHSNMRSCALPGYQPGASLRAWNSYFTSSRSKIIGIDCQPDTQFAEFGITTLLCDSTDAQAVTQAMKDFPHYMDVIADDASHVPADIFKTLDNFYPFLKQNGFYFIEDIANTGITLNDIRAHLQPEDLLFIAGEEWKMAVIKKQSENL